jgi:hypothetical protein
MAPPFYLINVGSGFHCLRSFSYSLPFSVMTHSLDLKVMARMAKARKCTAEIVGNIQQAKV